MSKKWYFASVIGLGLFIILMINSTKYNYSTIPDNNTILSINNIESITRISEKPKVLPIAKIIIPKIKLTENLYNTNSKENNVDKNITILKESIFPDNSNSIIFLAGHSGTGNAAYFTNLDKLNINDYIILQYKKSNYYYIIDKIFAEEKDGDIEINRTSNNQLVLTTCSKIDKNKQLIVNSYLKRKEEIT